MAVFLRIKRRRVLSLVLALAAKHILIPKPQTCRYYTKTEAAVKRFQKFARLAETGTADDDLKAALTIPRFDENVDVKLEDNQEGGLPFGEGTTKVIYEVGSTPGYVRVRTCARVCARVRS